MQGPRMLTRGADIEDVGDVKLGQTTWVESWRGTQSWTGIIWENRCAGLPESAVVEEILLV